MEQKRGAINRRIVCIVKMAGNIALKMVFCLYSIHAICILFNMYYAAYFSYIHVGQTCGIIRAMPPIQLHTFHSLRMWYGACVCRRWIGVAMSIREQTSRLCCPFFLSMTVFNSTIFPKPQNSTKKIMFTMVEIIVVLRM